MGILIMSGFWVAAIFKDFYGGLLVDPDRDAPMILGLNPNIFFFTLVTGFLVVGVALELRKISYKNIL